MDKAAVALHYTQGQCPAPEGAEVTLTRDTCVPSIGTIVSKVAQVLTDTGSKGLVILGNDNALTSQVQEQLDEQSIEVRMCDLRRFTPS